MKTVTSLKTIETNIRSVVDAALEKSGGLLRLAPCWVPRSFLQPGRRLKLHTDDLYSYGLDRGGIDERWFGSTTPAANENRTPDEGLSYCIFGDSRFTLANAIQECGAEIVGESIWNKFRRWPVYSKFFDNMGPIRITCISLRNTPVWSDRKGNRRAIIFPLSTILWATISHI